MDLHVCVLSDPQYNDLPEGAGPMERWLLLYVNKDCINLAYFFKYYPEPLSSSAESSKIFLETNLRLILDSCRNLLTHMLVSASCYCITANSPTVMCRTKKSSTRVPPGLCKLPQLPWLPCSCRSLQFSLVQPIIKSRNRAQQPYKYVDIIHIYNWYLLNQ